MFSGKGGVMSNRRTRRIQTLIKADLEKGERSENRVEEALQNLAACGEIHHYHRADPEGELDTQGIDFLVFPEPDWIIPLQVKSSVRGREEHLTEYGSQIPCIAVDLYSTPSELSEAILQELGLSVKFLEPVLELVAQERFNTFPTFPALV